MILSLRLSNRLSSLRLGPELIANGTFTIDTTGWTASAATLSVVTGVLRVTTTTAASGFAYQAISTLAGESYVLTGECIGVGAHLIAAGSTTIGVQLGLSSPGAGTKSVPFTATGTVTYINVRTAGATIGLARDFDNISVKRIS